MLNKIITTFGFPILIVAGCLLVILSAHLITFVQAEKGNETTKSKLARAALEMSNLQRTLNGSMPPTTPTLQPIHRS